MRLKVVCYNHQSQPFIEIAFEVDEGYQLADEAYLNGEADFEDKA